MRAIQKRIEPRTLAEHRCNTHASFENYADGEGLRASLCAEQGSICCYCMQRISPARERMKIEHWHCRAKYPQEQLDYGNLLGSCPGNEGQPRKEQHCDTRKSDILLSRTPADPNHSVESLIRYLGNGRIESTDAAFNAELNDVLNLNLPYLVNRRKAKLEGFTRSLDRKPLKRRAILRKFSEWSDANGAELQEFCGVVIYYLKKKLARC